MYFWIDWNALEDCPMFAIFEGKQGSAMCENIHYLDFEITEEEIGQLLGEN